MGFVKNRPGVKIIWWGTFLGIASKAFLGLKGQNGEVFNGMGLLWPGMQLL
jgi:hypothetical protein